MHIHILGIGGTFMSAIAQLARAQGHQVTGADHNCYPPVSCLLDSLHIDFIEGYTDSNLALSADLVIVGNAIKRGMPVLEDVLDNKKPYISGPQWLADNVLKNKKVIAVAGTHGKTTTSAMLSHILEYCGLNPSFLIGGVVPSFRTSARLTDSELFVVEADEYDSAFFDKRPKFMHYRPDILLLNNLEFDHADIYNDLEEIKKQFHFLLRTVPSKGNVIIKADDKALADVKHRGVFSNCEGVAIEVGADWQAKILEPSCREFSVTYKNECIGKISWNLLGEFNVQNALMAIAASFHAGADLPDIIKSLTDFVPVKRRLEVKSSYNNITVYDDFAHHPTAIANTITALKNSNKHERVIVILEFASYTMKSGKNAENLAKALKDVDEAIVLKPANFDLNLLASSWHFPHKIIDNRESILPIVKPIIRSGDAVVFMSNKSFGDLYSKI